MQYLHKALKKLAGEKDIVASQQHLPGRLASLIAIELHNDDVLELWLAGFLDS